MRDIFVFECDSEGTDGMGVGAATRSGSGRNMVVRGIVLIRWMVGV
jgi:hypothetical protein